MTDLITGINGFVGRHLAAAVTADGGRAVGLDLPACDLCDLTQVQDLVRNAAPERIYHLAAISSVGKSWQDRERVIAVNVGGTRNLLQAAMEVAPQARVLIVSTGAVYGAGSGEVIREDAPLRPANPYAQSKVEAEDAARAFVGRGLDARIVRPLGHTGPGQQRGFVVPDLASQIAAIKKGAVPRIRVGNLKVRREFGDARDVVRAYRLIVEAGKPGGIYNLATNEPHSIEEVARTLLRLAGVDAELVPDPALMRPTDESSPRLDTSRIRALGFAYQIPFEQTLADVLAWWAEQ